MLTITILSVVSMSLLLNSSLIIHLETVAQDTVTHACQFFQLQLQTVNANQLFKTHYLLTWFYESEFNNKKISPWNKIAYILMLTWNEEC